MGKKERFYVDIMAVHPEVTGSCILVVVKLPNKETIRFIVDCGLFQEREYEEDNYTLPFDSERVDFGFITHNHVDHTGRLPYLVKTGFRGSLYATESTCKLLPLALEDSCKVLKGVSKRKHKKGLYNKKDVEQTLALLQPCRYKETIWVNEYIKVTFFNNGHLMGAALILVQITYPGYEDINILFTGDYNDKNIFFDVEEIPNWVLELPLTIVQEATYGNIDSNEIQGCFVTNILKCISEGGTVVTPVFSLGRAQEILYELKCLQEEGKLSEKIPIYLDGKLAIAYTNIYLKDGLDIKETMRRFLPENLTFVTTANRNAVLNGTEQKIVLTTSGMGTYGPAQVYIPQYLTRKGSLIHFTGYVAEKTLGRRLKEAAYGEKVEIGGLLVIKLADVEYTSEFSAHAKADEMISFLQKFKSLRLVLVNHGEAIVKREFAERVLQDVKTKAVGILGKEYFFRINPYGLVKTLSSKFR